MCGFLLITSSKSSHSHDWLTGYSSQVVQANQQTSIDSAGDTVLNHRMEITLSGASIGFAAGMLIYTVLAVALWSSDLEQPSGTDLLLLSVVGALTGAWLAWFSARHIPANQPAKLHFGALLMVLSR
nr:hypothetical protein [Brucella pseudintermedia]